MIGIIGAMDVEMEALLEALERPESEEISGVRFTRGKLCGREVVLAVCGIGKVFASLCAEAMILRYAPALIVNIGVAGTLTNELSIGDMAIGTAAVCHDMDTTAIGDPPGWISGIGRIEIPLSEDAAGRFEDACRKVGVKARLGVIASGDKFISDRAEKQAIAERYRAVACEMEGQAITQVCFVNGTPCAVLRSISDNADGSAIEYEQFKRLAAAHSTAVLRAFLEEE